MLIMCQICHYFVKSCKKHKNYCSMKFFVGVSCIGPIFSTFLGVGVGSVE